MTTHPQPARVDLGDGDSLILFRTSNHHTTVRFHSANPNTQLAGAVMETDALRAALDKVAPVTDEPDYDMAGGVTAAAIEAEADGRVMWAMTRIDHLTPERARSLVQENDELRARIGRVEEARDLYRQDVMTAERREQEFADRAEKAEQERDSEQAAMSRAIEENLRLRTENPRPEKYDAHAEAAEKVGALLRARTVDLVEALAERDKARRERDHACKSLKESDAALREMRDHPRPLTADDITDEAIERAREAGSVLVGVHWDSVVIEAMLRAALTPPPSRPEAAEKIEALVDEWKLLPESPDCPRPTLPDFLAERGVRMTGAES